MPGNCLIGFKPPTACDEPMVTIDINPSPKNPVAALRAAQWWSLLVKSRNFAFVTLLAFVAAQASAADLTKTTLVCRIMRAPTKYVGLTITFAGRYLTDHIERSLILPRGCNSGIGLGELSPEAEKVLEGANDPTKPDRRIDAIFNGTLVQEKPNNFEFHNDDGVQLSVSSVTDLKIHDLKAR
jgi:hypothetical protein